LVVVAVVAVVAAVIFPLLLSKLKNEKAQRQEEMNVIMIT